MTTTFVRRAAVLATLLFASTLAHADRAEAERFFRNGAAAYKAGQFAAAAENFDKAFERFQAAEIAFSAAQAHRLQYQADVDPRHLDRAITLFERYLADAPKGSKRKEAQTHLDRLREIRRMTAPGAGTAVAAAAAPVAETPQLYISVALDTALITVDGKPVQRYTPVDVEAGEHVVVVSADGHLTETRTVPVGTGRSMVAIDLAAKPALLAVRTAPEARITVDGRPVVFRGTTTEVMPGRRLVTVAARGRAPVSQEVELEPGESLQLDAPLAPTAQRRAVTWVWIASGALAASALVTGGIALHADFEAADLRDQQPFGAPGSTDAVDYANASDRRDRYRTLGFVLGGAAVLGFVGGLAMYYLDNPAADSQLRPLEPKGEGGFMPMAFGAGLGDGLGLGYGGSL